MQYSRSRMEEAVTTCRPEREKGRCGHWNQAMSPSWSCGWNCALGKDAQPLTICGPAWRSHLPISHQCLALAKPYQKSKGREVGSRQATEASLMHTGQSGEE